MGRQHDFSRSACGPLPPPRLCTLEALPKRETRRELPPPLLVLHGTLRHHEFGQSREADHAKVLINYNCDPRDLVAGSVRETYARVRDYIGHVHLHDLEADFPYLELFGLLQADGYEGYCSLEVDCRGGDPEKVMALYGALWRAQVALAAGL